MLIDFHNHVWPPAVARRALGGNIPDMTLFGDGTTDGLASAQDAAGIDLSVCLAVANTPAQVEVANRFIGTVDRRRFIPFGTVHPELPVEENLAHLRANAVAGVKLHPVFQGYRLDDPKLVAVLEALAGELPVIVHVGDGGGSDGSACTPAMVGALAARIPDLDLVACHLGGYHRLAEAGTAVHGSAVFLDTSWPPSLATLDPAEVRAVIRRHGVDRVVFASDWPTADPAAEVAAVRSLGLDDAETAAVLGGNAARLLGLDSGR